MSLILLLGTVTTSSFASVLDPNSSEETPDNSHKPLNDVQGGKDCSGLCWVEEAKSSTIFDPKMRITYKTSFLFWSTEDTITLGISECSVVWFYGVPLRICSRISRPCRPKHEDAAKDGSSGWADPDPLGNQCSVYTREMVQPDNDYEEPQPRLTFDRKWAVGDPPVDISREELKAGVPTLCAYEDPMDGMDTNAGFSPMHKGTSREQAMGMAQAAAQGAVIGAMAGVILPGLGAISGAAIGAGVGIMVSAIMSTYNHVVIRDIGCMPMPLAPFPPPFADSAEILPPPPPPTVMPLPGDRSISDPLFEVQPTSTFEQPKLRAELVNLDGTREFYDIGHGECNTFAGDRQMCGFVYDEKPNEICLHERQPGDEIVVHGCVPRQGFMPKPTITQATSAPGERLKVSVGLGEPAETKELFAEYDTKNPSAAADGMCDLFYQTRLCAYRPCSAYRTHSSGAKECIRYRNQLCVRGYNGDHQVVAKKSSNGIPGEPIQDKPNDYINDMWVYMPPAVQCVERDDEDKCIRTSNPTTDPASPYNISGAEFEPGNPQQKYEIRPLTAEELGLCIPIADTCQSTGICNQDLKVWLDANDSTMVTADAQGKTTEWKDKSAATRSATAGSSQAPDWVQSSQDTSRKVLRFADDTVMEIAPVIDEKDSFEIYLVAETAKLSQNTPSNYPYILATSYSGMDQNNPGLGSIGLSLDADTGISLHELGNQGQTIRHDLIKSNRRLQDVALVYVRVANKNPTLFVDGRYYGTNSLNLSEVSMPDSVGGYDPTQASQGEAGYVDAGFGELLMYHNALTPSERARIEHYLYDKWFALQEDMPNAVNGLRFWFDAADSTRVLENPDCGGSAAQSVTEGGSVTCVDDKSGFGLDVIAQSKPKLQTESGKRGVVFAAADAMDAANISGDALFNTDRMTAILVVDPIATAGTRTIMQWGNDPANQVTVGTSQGKFRFGFGEIAAADALTGLKNVTTKPQMVTVIKDNNAMYLHVNGSLDNYKPHSGRIDVIPQGLLRLGKDTQGGTGYSGAIHEAVIYNRDLDVRERRAIEAHLMRKWEVSE